MLAFALPFVLLAASRLGFGKLLHFAVPSRTGTTKISLLQLRSVRKSYGMKESKQKLFFSFEFQRKIIKT